MNILKVIKMYTFKWLTCMVCESYLNKGVMKKEKKKKKESTTSRKSKYAEDNCHKVGTFYNMPTTVLWYPK